MKVFIKTLGCKLNQSESSVLMHQFSDAGYITADSSDDADICIINTCTVTSASDSKCRNAIRRMLRKNPKAIIAVIGCYTESLTEVPEWMDGVDILIGNQEKMNLLKHLPDKKVSKTIFIKKVIQKSEFSTCSDGQISSNVRAFLKIQDGCSFHCSYCIIPSVRGPSRSRNLKNLLEESKSLRTKGVKEVVLTGINLGTYHSGKNKLVEVIDQLHKTGFTRIRISSIELTTLTDEILSRMSDSNHSLSPHLHIPLQSASNSVLKSMNRHYTKEQFLKKVSEVIEYIPDVSIGTDVLLGTPFETEEYFHETLAFLENLPLHYIHPFPYSERKGTPLAGEKPIPIPVRKKRTREVLLLSKKKKDIFAKQYLGKNVEVLMEKSVDDYWQGHSGNYLPIKAFSKDNIENQLMNVQLEKISDEWIIGKLLS